MKRAAGAGSGFGKGGNSLGVVVTGGTSGLGLAMALEFLMAGDRVVICGRDRTRLEAAVSRLKAQVPGCALYGIPCDVSNPADVAALGTFAVSKLGIVDRWINNAGTAGRLKRPVWELDPADIDETCRTNLSGSLMLCAEAARIMRRQPAPASGPVFHIFNMGFSASGARSSPTAVPHRASKLAVALTTGYVRRELKRAGSGSIGIHELSPGLVLTDLLLKDSGIRDRRLFNALAETPETVAAVLVPRIRSERGAGGTIRFRPMLLMIAMALASFFGYGRGRFFDDDGRRTG
ncbi:MAG: SDR family oxidoreductase [Chlorobiaceae bacterium]|nr:SDR family oxidoreductase [Chlorobiaceae bacterium]